MNLLRCLPVIFAIFSLLISGCASGPSFAEASRSLPPLDPAKGRIYLYRTTVMGTAIQPDIRVNGEVVGSAKPKGFLVVDRPAGQYQISTSTEVNRTLSLTLSPGQTRYVKLSLSMGFMVGHVYPELVENVQGSADVQECSFLGLK
jgi:Protein of unknown function (DUF2846)